MRYLKIIPTYKLHTSYERKTPIYVGVKRAKAIVTVIFDLLFEKFNIGYNYFNLRERVSYLVCVFLMTRLSDSTINFEHVNLTMAFHLLLKILLLA